MTVNQRGYNMYLRQRSPKLSVLSDVGFTTSPILMYSMVVLRITICLNIPLISGQPNQDLKEKMFIQ